MKVYLSSSMTGVKGFNYPAFFAKQKELASLGYEVLNPAEVGTKHGLNKTYEFYLKESLKMLLEADKVLVFGFFSESRGVDLELRVASSCGIPICYAVESLKETI